MNRSANFLATASIALTACNSTTSQNFEQPNSKSKASRTNQIDAVYSVAPSNAPSGAVIDNFARNFLNTLQVRSIAERREHCGYFLQT